MLWPPPLTGAEPGTFTHHSITQRLPVIAKKLCKDGDLTPAQRASVRQLLAEIPDAPLRALTQPEAPGASTWQATLAAHEGSTWLTAPWFVVETYFYRRIAEETGFFATGHDAFGPIKRHSLDQAWPFMDRLAPEDSTPRWSPRAWQRVLMAALWGNQADLSLHPSGVPISSGGATEQATRLLVNDAETVFSWIEERRPLRQVEVVLDNVGLELLADLALADYLLRAGVAGRVRLWAKRHPTFVSDATPHDVEQTLQRLVQHPATEAWGDRLAEALKRGALEVTSHLYWNGPLAGWALPHALHDALAEADLCISKGDANYRRWHGDRAWPPTTPFAEVLRYLRVPLLALRSLKAELVSGLAPGQAERTAAQDPAWMTNGRWGLVQFAAPRPPE
ncbi:MAG: damage-control phosphatase ARMT1 family protein [Bacteroidota bacterium]